MEEGFDNGTYASPWAAAQALAAENPGQSKAATAKRLHLKFMRRRRKVRPSGDEDGQAEDSLELDAYFAFVEEREADGKEVLVLGTSANFRKTLATVFLRSGKVGVTAWLRKFLEFRRFQQKVKADIFKDMEPSESVITRFQEHYFVDDVLGYMEQDFLEIEGCPVKDMAQSISWKKPVIPDN